jgi:hypothetical protein
MHEGIKKTFAIGDPNHIKSIRGFPERIGQRGASRA